MTISSELVSTFPVLLQLSAKGKAFQECLPKASHSGLLAVKSRVAGLPRFSC